MLHVPAGFAAASTSPAASTASIFAVAGTNLDLYVGRSTQVGFTDLGGQIPRAPALVRLPSGPTYYLASGVDGRLYWRTDGTGWARLAPRGGSCLDASAALDGATLVFACEGTDRQLYVGRSALGPAGPSITSWARLGGLLAAGPAVLAGNGKAAYLVIGGTYTNPDRTVGNTYARTDTTGWTRTKAYCTPGDRPAAAIAQQTFYFACTQPAGNTNQLIVTRQVDSQAPVGFAGGGDIVGGVGVAAASDGSTATVYAIGTDAAIYTKTVTAAGAVAGWGRPGGRVIGGVQATPAG